MITMKLEVESMKVDLFNLLALIYEIDLYPQWFPFCKRSTMLGKFGKAKKMGSIEFFMPFPLSNRYSNIYGFGVNRFNTNGSILVIAKSAELVVDENGNSYFADQVTLPERNGLVKLKLYYYAHEIIPLSPTEIKMRSVFLIDPQMDNIPDKIVNWGAKQFTHFMYGKLMSHAKNLKGTEYEKRIREGESQEFYDWAKSKLTDFYVSKGWISEA